MSQLSLDVVKSEIQTASLGQDSSQDSHIFKRPTAVSRVQLGRPSIVTEPGGQDTAWWSQDSHF